MAQLGVLTDVVKRYCPSFRNDFLEVPEHEIRRRRYELRLPRDTEYERTLRILEMEIEMAGNTVLSLPTEDCITHQQPKRITDLLGKRWRNKRIGDSTTIDLCDAITNEMTRFYLASIYGVNESSTNESLEDFEFVKRLILQGIETVYDPVAGKEQLGNFLLDYDSASSEGNLFFNWIKNIETVGRRAKSIHYASIAHGMADIYLKNFVSWSERKRIKCLELISDTTEYSISLHPDYRRHIFPMFFRKIE